MPDFPQRPGELKLPFDPAKRAADAGLVFIGRIRTPWPTRQDCPRNPREARERGGGATIEIDEPYRAGLAGLEGYSHVMLIYWMHEARRDLIVLAPGHLAAPRGAFALRSPVRPNPIAVSVAAVTSLDAAGGRIGIDAIDCIDGTPLLDIKPYLPSVDAVPAAVVG
jgi:tRNA-Thr(GGU) m(6)t(6)A37 methyltransferase TsaA